MIRLLCGLPLAWARCLPRNLGAVLLTGGVLWSMFYYLFADGFHGGQSFGKRWMGMRAIDATTGAPCSFGQSFLRNLLLAVLGPIDRLFISANVISDSVTRRRERSWSMIEEEFRIPITPATHGRPIPH
jgi:uncharacterized RDD family membrane protein YckC